MHFTVECLEETYSLTMNIKNLDSVLMVFKVLLKFAFGQIAHITLLLPPVVLNVPLLVIQQSHPLYIFLT